MADTFTARVRSAAVAGWWTILIMAVWMTLSWLAWIGMLSAKPDFMLAMWGGDAMTWAQMHEMVVTFFAVFKMVILTFLIATIWLSLRARQLRRQNAGQ